MMLRRCRGSCWFEKRFFFNEREGKKKADSSRTSATFFVVSLLLISFLSVPPHNCTLRSYFYFPDLAEFRLTANTISKRGKEKLAESS